MLKDINYCEIRNDLEGKLIRMKYNELVSLENIMQKDSKFLADHNLMDYSALLAIE